MQVQTSMHKYSLASLFYKTYSQSRAVKQGTSFKTYKLGHEISNNVFYATSKALDQPAHMHSLVWAFASHLNILSVKLLTEHNLAFLSLRRLHRPLGYKTFSMLNTAEHEIYPAYKCQNANDYHWHFNLY